jgi:hypothetical protein
MGLWNVINATNDEFEELIKVSWISAPRQQPQIHPVNTAIPQLEEEASVVLPTPPRIASIVFAVSQECPYLLMDIEGKETDVVEITVAACTTTEVLKVFHGYARPRSSTFFAEARYCHGLRLDVLQQLTTEHQDHDNLKNRVRDFCSSYPTAVVLSADKAKDSDVYRYLQQWSTSRRYSNIGLRDWIERIHEQSHKEALKAKRDMTPFKGVTCPYRQLHDPILNICKRKRADGTRPALTASDRANISSGTHCSLTDVRELWLNLIETNRWPDPEKCAPVLLRRTPVSLDLRV